MRIPIVDESDNLLYYKDSKDRDPREEITRSAGVWVLNEKNEILLAKRSKNKVNFPNLWGPSATGIVEEGESYEENVIKEAKEEIGIDLVNVILGPKERESDNHEFFAQYFFARVSSDTKFVLQESEVDEVKWVTLENLKDWYAEHPKEFIPTFPKSLRVVDDYHQRN